MRLLLPWTLLLCAACSAGGSGDDPEPKPDPDDFVFCSDRTGNFELYRRRFGELVQLTDDPLYDSWWPRASPDGARLVFYRSLVADRPPNGGANNNYEAASLWSMDLPAGAPVQVIAQGDNGWLAQGVADWSPDGTQLVMAAQSAPDGNRWHLFVTDAAGVGATRISTRTSLYLDPSWSPDGTQIVYVAFPDGYAGIDLAKLEVHRCQADGSGEVRLTTDDLRDHDPYWSPDGGEIAFETLVDPTWLGVGRWGLRAVAPDGGGLRTILDDGNINTLARWSPDSLELSFHRLVFGSGEKFRLARVGVDGTGLEHLTVGGDYDDSDIDLLER